MKRADMIEVDADANGDPLSLSRNGRKQRVTAVHERWRLEDGWWGNEERRCYYRIQTGRGSVFDIYHETVSDKWYLDRILD